MSIDQAIHAAERDRVAEQPVGTSREGPSVGAARPTISLIMIVRDEAENLPELLAPLAGKFDEVVVIDTGSDDGTPEIAREFGATVSTFEWINDFAAARNESIRQASGDWLFWLDADDRMLPDEVDRLRKLIVRHPARDVAYYCHLRTLGSSWSSDQDLLQVRLFPNLPGVGFVGPVHERVTDSLVELGVRIEVAPIEIIHTGYMDRSRLPEKYERNLEILTRILEKEPSNLQARFQLVMQLDAMGAKEDAFEQLDVLGPYVEAETRGDTVLAYRYQLLKGAVHRRFGENQAAQRCFQQVVRDHPKLGIAHFLLAATYCSEGRWEEMREHLLKAEYYGIAVEILPIPLTRIYFEISTMMAVYYMRLERWILAAQEYRKALALQEEYLPFYADMGDAFFLANDIERALRAYQVGIQVHDRAVERLDRQGALGSGTRTIGTVAEMTAESRAQQLERLYRGVARVLMKQKRQTAARAALEEGTRRLPNSLPLALHYLEWMLQAGRTTGAKRLVERVFEIDPTSRAVFETVVNLHLRYKRRREAVPLLGEFWRRFPDQWDAALIGIVIALRIRDDEAATRLLREVREHLIDAGVTAASEWPLDWEPDHPLLAYFSNEEFWTEHPPDGLTDDATERQQAAEAFAERLAAACRAIRAILLMAREPSDELGTTGAHERSESGGDSSVIQGRERRE